MRRRPDIGALIALAAALGAAAAAEPAREAPKGGGLFDAGAFSNRKGRRGVGTKVDVAAFLT